LDKKAELASSCQADQGVWLLSLDEHKPEPVEFANELLG
jgi:hypothetical protein